MRTVFLKRALLLCAVVAIFGCDDGGTVSSAVDGGDDGGADGRDASTGGAGGEAGMGGMAGAGGEAGAGGMAGAGGEAGAGGQAGQGGGGAGAGGEAGGGGVGGAAGMGGMAGAGGMAGEGGGGGIAPCEDGAQAVCEVDGCMGIQICVDGEFGACVGPAETCDGADNDCDGEIDEGFDLGEACSAGVGACAADGVVACSEDGSGTACDAVPGEPGDELCGNDVDEDCDGALDNGFDDLGTDCAAGVGACLAAGAVVCAEDGASTTCDAAPGDPTPELCGNEIDEDCDGALNNGFDTLGADCAAGEGACAAVGQFICGPNGDEVTCNAVAGVPEPEACDGADNDCDGTTDEDAAVVCFTGPEDAADVGLCASGTQACVDGALAACEGDITPVDEVCNGSDDDCDGEVDEGEGNAPIIEQCYTGPEGTDGVGGCQGGRRSCDAGNLGPCEGEVVPQLEICDGIDNDCNGEVDEIDGCDCLPPAEQPCYTGPEGTEGVGICQGGTSFCEDNNQFGECLGQVVAEVETCNGLDDDCDGSVDEAVDGTGLPCNAGLGECAAEGLTVCDSEANEVVCDAELGEPADELCDDLDNDCDGATDEELGLDDACELGVGACEARGVLVCDAEGGVECNAEPGDPAAEVCDDVDNDCDDETDEGLGLGDVCVVGVGACEREGARICGENGEVACDAVAGLPGAEICNLVDDDCDGLVDEGNPGGGGDCATGQPGVCGPGVRVCRAGNFECDQLAQPADEVCDGLDNDCDATTDEGEGGPLTADCYEGPDGTRDVGICTGGARTCQNGEFGNCAGQVLPRAEVCNSADDDCNGQLDDVAGVDCVCDPGEVQDCYEGPDGTRDVGVCVGGRQTCLPDGSGFSACEGQVLPDAEVCDGVDNDCNAIVDDADGVGAACAAGIGGCRVEGQVACDVDAGQTVCDAVPGEPAPEICDNIDNDCNEAVDDVEGLGDACTVGLGVCAANGSQVCDVDAQQVVCDAEPGEASEERCNLRDDDCDGETDEDFADACVSQFPINLIDGGQFLWDLLANASMSNGTRDAWDGGIRLTVGNSAFPNQPAALFLDERTVEFGPATISGVAVTRQVFVSPDDNYTRYLEIVENPTGIDLDLRVRILSNLGSDNGTRVLATSSGDTNITAEDGWAATDDGTPAGADPALAHVIAGRGPVQPALFSEAPTGFINYEYEVTVPAGGRVVIAHYSSQNNEAGQAVAKAPELQALGDDEAFAIGDVVNFGFQEGDLRLENGANEREGRLEIFHEGQWGTICDDRWSGDQGLLNGDVACQQLGFPGALAVDYEVNLGEDPIWLDDVACVGDEAALIDCPASPFGVNNCDHQEDVSVRCLAIGRCRVDAQCPGDGVACVDGACAEAVCDDGLDNDGDGDSDCDDEDCLLFCDPCAVLQCGDEAECIDGACVLEANIMQCGNAVRDVAEIIPAAGYTLVESCTPNARTQAILVTRNGSNDFVDEVFEAYVAGGGRVITEAFASDDVYGAVTGTAVDQAGLISGGCDDVVPPVVQFTPEDRFWSDNADVALLPFGDAGCGSDISAYPGVTFLGGYTAETRSLGYIDVSEGRAWLVEADWQDGAPPASNSPEFADTLTLLRYMMFDSGIPAAEPIAARGGEVVLSESIDDFDPQWARPNQNCTPRADTTHYFEAFKVVNLTGFPQTLTIDAAWDGDGYLHVFSDPFDRTVLDNCLSGDDDFIGVRTSQILNQVIEPGQTLVIVGSTFSQNAAIGAFDITVTTDQ